MIFLSNLSNGKITDYQIVVECFLCLGVCGKHKSTIPFGQGSGLTTKLALVQGWTMVHFQGTYWANSHNSLTCCSEKNL